MHRKIAFVLASTLFLLMTACAHKAPDVPGASAAVTVQALDVLKQAGHVATSIRDFERAQVAKGLISTAQDQVFNYNFAKLQGIADRAIDEIVAGSTPVRQAARSILAAVEDLKLAGQDAITALVEALKSLLAALVGGSVPVPAQ